jgi:ABC-type bacteriocin/lantibiotic exporter with double-glycine peptidase domain
MSAARRSKRPRMVTYQTYRKADTVQSFLGFNRDMSVHNCLFHCTFVILLASNEQIMATIAVYVAVLVVFVASILPGGGV